MEHRHGSRKAVDISATVEIPSGTILPARITDVSFGGICVRVPTEKLRLYAPITLHFWVQRHNTAKSYRWKGFVTRILDGGVGAMFESPDPEEQAGLLALLDYAERKQPPLAVAG